MTAVGEFVGGRYRAERLLGSGGMAAVWLGRDLLLDRPVAIKTLAGAGLTEPMATERFEQEARSVAQLAHPNVVAVHDFGTDNGAPYLIMELVDGVTVAAMLADGPLTITQAAAIAAQTCDGLAAAHGAGVVHRDIKPANLLVTPGGVVKICDFGIARMLGVAGQASLTGETDAMGTASYMAPERVDDQPIDHRVDLYGLGCTLYAMLTGAPPFVADDPMVVLHQHLTVAPVPVTQLRSDTPAAMATLVDDLLAKAPASRPADASEVRSRLLAALPDGEIAAAQPPVTAVAQTAALAGVRPGAALADAGSPTHTILTRPVRVAAVATLALLVAVLIGLWGTSRAPQAPAGPVVAASMAATSTPVSTPTSLPQAPVIPSAAPTAPAGAVPSTHAPVANPPAPVDPIAALRVSIQRQVDTGNLALSAATDLYKKADEIAREANEGDLQDAAKKVDEFRHRLDDLLAEGKLTTAGHVELTDRINAVEIGVT